MNKWKKVVEFRNKIKDEAKFSSSNTLIYLFFLLLCVFIIFLSFKLVNNEETDRVNLTEANFTRNETLHCDASTLKPIASVRFHHYWKGSENLQGQILSIGYWRHG